MKKLLMLALLAGAAQAHAQGAASAPTAPTAAPVSAAKKELVNKVLSLQQPAFENMAREIVMRPVMQLGEEAGMALQQQVPAEKRESVAKTIDGDIRAFVDESVPIVRDRAQKLAPTTIGPILEERFTEDELKQLVPMLESPMYKKYQQLGSEMQRALGSKLVAEANPLLTPKFQALTQKVRVSLGVPPPGGAGSGAARGNGAGTGSAAPKAPARAASR